MKLRINTACDFSSISVLPPQSRSDLPLHSQMKLRINTACDFSSISVLPPQSRRSKLSSSAVDPGGSGKTWPPAVGSQSFSPGMSLSQVSQGLFDEVLTNEQRLGSEDQSSKKVACLPSSTSTAEESQLQYTRAGHSIFPRWNSVSSGKRCQGNEELDYMVGLMENSLTRLGRIADSILGDVMQVNKTLKEVALEVERMRKEMTVQDQSLHLILKGQEDIKVDLDMSLKNIHELSRKDSDPEKMQEITTVLLSLPNQIESLMCSHQDEVFKTVKEVVVDIRSGYDCTEPLPPKSPVKKSYKAMRHQKDQCQKIQILVSPMVECTPSASFLEEETEDLESQKAFPFIKKRQTFNIKEIEEGDYSKSKMEFPFISKRMNLEAQQVSQTNESDEEMNLGFSCLLKGRGAGHASYMAQEARKEIMHTIKKTRRKKKLNNIIILD